MNFDDREWLLTNKMGSFAMGSLDRVLRRKYHGLWISRALKTQNPMHLLLDTLEHLTLNNKRNALANYNFGHGTGSDAIALIQKCKLDVSQPDSVQWLYQFNSENQLKRTLHIHDVNPISMSPSESIELKYEWSGNNTIRLELEPLFTLRNVHDTTFENIALNGTIKPINDSTYSFNPYDDLAYLHIHIDKKHEFQRMGEWYKNFVYSEELSRGYPTSEDAFAPAKYVIHLSPGETCRLIISLINSIPLLNTLLVQKENYDFKHQHAVQLPGADEEKTDFKSDLKKSLQVFCYQHDREFVSIIAGYPWFSSWARDTMISLPGISLAQDNPMVCLNTLLNWAPLIENSLFGTHQIDNSKKSHERDLNSTGFDSPFLWGRALRFLVTQHPKHLQVENSSVTHKLLEILDRWIYLFFQQKNEQASITDLGFFTKALDSNKNKAASWMDAICNGVAVTPRHGYAIDINILFFECISFLLDYHKKMKIAHTQLYQSYLKSVLPKWKDLFWNEDRGFICDGFDGVNLDKALRPNQLWALASPLDLFTPTQAQRTLTRIIEELLTPVGLRTLSPLDSRYQGVYFGDQTTRDRSYHQGTVWPWLLGTFTEATIKHLGSAQTKEILHPVFKTLENHFYNEACIGQISEIFDGNSPHHPRGAPAQAWSSAELLRSLWLLER